MVALSFINMQQRERTCFCFDITQIPGKKIIVEITFFCFFSGSLSDFFSVKEAASDSLDTLLVGYDTNHSYLPYLESFYNNTR